MQSVLQVLQKNPFACVGGIESVSLCFDRAFKALKIEPGYLFIGNVKSSLGRKTFILKPIFTVLSCDFGYFSPTVLCRFVRSFDNVLVHYPAPFLLLVVSLAGVRFDVYYHSDIVRQKVTGFLIFPLIFACLLRSRRIFVSSPNYPEGSLMLRLLRKKVRVFTPAADQTLLRLKPDEEIVSRIPKPYFLFLGADRSYKSLETICKAAILADDEDFMYVIAGPGTERFEAPNLLRFGQISDSSKVALLRGCLGMVLVSNSRAEAFGMSLIEGLMFGKPLVTTQINSGPNYVNVDGVTGFSIAVNDHVALNQSCRKLFAGTIQKVEENCSQRFKKFFSYDGFCKTTAEYFKI